MRLGNTPTQHTLFWLERAKSFAFFIKFVENSEAAFDLTGCAVQLTVRQPARYGGAIVLGVAADLGVEAEGVAAFKLQAVDLDLDLGSYDFDVTLTNSVGYSIPVLKGEFVIGDNTDPATSNMYTDVGQDSVVVVDFGGGNEVSVTVDYSWDPTHEHTTADIADFDPADYVTIAEGPTYFEIANAVGNHESAPDPHPQYLTQAEGDALYTNDDALDAHIAAADPHPIYLTQAEADALYTGDTVPAHEAAPDPHPQYLTQAEGDALYSPTVDPYGIHVITWDGTNWWYRGAITTTRPSGIAPYLEGGYAVWNTALDITFATPPLLAIPGDGWLRHGGAQI